MGSCKTGSREIGSCKAGSRKAGSRGTGSRHSVSCGSSCGSNRFFGVLVLFGVLLLPSFVIASAVAPLSSSPEIVTAPNVNFYVVTLAEGKLSFKEIVESEEPAREFKVEAKTNEGAKELLKGTDKTGRKYCVLKTNLNDNYVVATFPSTAKTDLDSALGGVCNDGIASVLLQANMEQLISRLGTEEQYSLMPGLTLAPAFGLASFQFEVKKDGSLFIKLSDKKIEPSEAYLFSKGDTRSKGLKSVARVYAGIGKQTIPVKGTPTETNVALIWFRDDLVQQDLVDLKVVTGTKEKTVTDALLAFATAAPAAVFETAAASVDVYQAADGKATAILCPKHDKDLATVEEKQPLFFIKKEDGSVAPEQIALNKIKDVTKEPGLAGLASADIDRAYGCSSATFNKPGKYLVTYEAALKDSNPNSLMSYLKREASGSGGAVLPEYGTEREAIRIIVRSQSERFLQSKPGERVLTLVKPVAATSTPKVTLYATKAFQESMEQAGLTFETGADGKKTVSLYVPEFDTSNEKMYEAFAGTDYLDAFTKLTNEGEKKKFWGVLDRYADEKTINSFLKKHLDEGPTVFAPIREYEKVCGLGEETVLFAECRQKGEDVKWKLHWIGEANKPAGYDDALPDGSDAAAAATETSSSIMFAHCPAQTVSALPESAGSSDTPSPSDSCPAQPAQTKTNGASGTEETKAKPTACTVKGSGFAPQAGICILVDNCNNKGQFGYPGFCPGDKNIRCCIKKPIATCALTKDSVHGIKRGTVGDCIETQVCYYQGKIPYAKSQGTSGCPLGANIECCIGLEEEPPQQSPVLAAAEPQTIIKAFFGTRVLTPNQFKEFKEKARSCNDRIMVGDAPVQLTAQAKNLWRAQVNYAEEKEKAKLLRYAALWKNILADNTDAMQGTLFDKYAGAEAGVVEAELKDLDFNSLEATGFAIKFVTSLGGGKSKFKPSSLVAPVLFETSNSVPAYISEVSKNDPKLNHYVVPINQKDYGDVAAVLEIQMPEEDALKALGYNKKDYKNVVPGTETNLVSGFLTQMDCVKGKMETPSIGGMRTLARDEPLERGECVKLPITDAEKALKAVSLMKSVKKNGESYHYAVDVLQACNALVPYYNQEFDVTAQVGNKIVLNSLDLSKKFLYDITLCAKKDACVSAKPIKASELIYGKGEKPAVEVSAPPATVAPEGESADETEQEGGPTGVGAASGPEKAPGPKALPEPPAPVEKTPTERQVESVAPRVKDVGLPPKAAELIAEGNPSVTLNKNVQLRLEKGVTSIGGNRAALYYSVMNDQFSQRAMYPMLGGYPGMFSPSGGWYGGGFGYNNLQAMLSFPFVWNPASMNALTTGSPFTYGGYNFYTPSSQFLALALGDFSFGYFKTDPYGNQGNFRALGGALSLGPGFSIAGFGAGSLRVLVKIDELQPGEEVTFVMVPPEGQEFTLEDAKALPDPIVEIGSVSFIEPPAVQEAEQPEKEVVPAATDYTIPAVLVVLVALVGYWWLGRK